MNTTPKSLREHLRAECPPLADSLEESWRRAEREWLPAIGRSEGSFNSLPHFRNIEDHLNRLLYPGGNHLASLRVSLTPLEIYLLLAGILFHDFGRIYGNDEHARATAEHLTRDYAHLGIPSAELARCLAGICLYHDPKRKGGNSARDLAEARGKLREIQLDPFGSAREVYVATLLALGDHLDASYQRAVPRYVESSDQIGFKGAFRRLVLGTAYDRATRTLKTTVELPDEGTEERESDLTLLKDNFTDDKNNEPGPNLGERSATRCKLYSEVFGVTHPVQLFVKALAGELRLKHKAGVSPRSLPPEYSLAVAIRDLEENRKFLKGVSGDLFDMGLPIEGWFLQHGHALFVFDERGDWAFEPVCPPVFLDRVGKNMWELCRSVLGRQQFGYTTLADSLRERNVDLVRLAVARLAAWSCYPASIVRAGPETWSWIDQSKSAEDLLKITGKRRESIPGQAAPAIAPEI